jgi:hypothetical protein
VVTDFIHGPGDKIHALASGACFCTSAGIGILKYDAFQDAEYLGREDKYIEYLGQTKRADHYLKGPHHVWFDVETGLPLRAWQPTNGLQVYYNWTVGPVAAHEFAIPKSCISINCTAGYADVTSVAALPSARDMQLSPAAPSADVARAQQPLPRAHFTGHDFATMSHVLNAYLRRIDGLRVRPCDHFTLAELQSEALKVFQYLLPQFQALYMAQKDRRQLLVTDTQVLSSLWAQQRRIAAVLPRMSNISRDGLCHEVVLWYAHHVADADKPRLHQQAVLPLLPDVRHAEDAPISEDRDVAAVHQHYNKQIACSACHVK